MAIESGCSGLSIEPTGEGLDKYLRELHPGKEQRERAEKLIGELGTPDSYQKREAATKGLLLMPTLPTELLVSATKGDDPEVRWRAKHVLAVGKPQQQFLRPVGGDLMPDDLRGEYGKLFGEGGT